MNGDYLVIDKKVLPEVYEKVIATKKILQEGKVKEITEATKLAAKEELDNFMEERLAYLD